MLDLGELKQSMMRAFAAKSALFCALKRHRALAIVQAHTMGLRLERERRDLTYDCFIQDLDVRENAGPRSQPARRMADGWVAAALFPYWPSKLFF